MSYDGPSRNHSPGFYIKYEIETKLSKNWKLYCQGWKKNSDQTCANPRDYNVSRHHRGLVVGSPETLQTITAQSYWEGLRGIMQRHTKPSGQWYGNFSAWAIVICHPEKKRERTLGDIFTSGRGRGTFWRDIFSNMLPHKHSRPTERELFI